MTTQQIQLLKLGISPIDERAELIVEAGLEWVKNNTTLDFDTNNDEDLKALPAGVRLFLVKYCDINMQTAGVASESIEGLSQSFNTGDHSAMLWQFAEEFLAPYLTSRIKFVPAQRRFL